MGTPYLERWGGSNASPQGVRCLPLQGEARSLSILKGGARSLLLLNRGERCLPLLWGRERSLPLPKRGEKKTGGRRGVASRTAQNNRHDGPTRVGNPSENPPKKRVRRSTRGTDTIDNSCEVTGESNMICPITCGVSLMSRREFRQVFPAQKCCSIKKSPARDRIAEREGARLLYSTLTS